MKKTAFVPQSVELFTGAGGLALATHLVGFHHRGLFEWNGDACETLRTNADARAVKGLRRWKGCVVEGDVSSVDFQEFEGVDLVAGGPPCQPFSLGGKHQGKEDRRDMIPQFIRAVREARPRAFIMENVRGLTRRAFATYLDHSLLQLSYPEIERRKGEGWQRHLARLQKHHTSSPRPTGLAYNVVSRVLNAADYGVPQCRERLFIVGFRTDVDAHWSFPAATHSEGRLRYEQREGGEYWNRVGARTGIARMIASRRMPQTPKEDVFALLPWKTVREAIGDLPSPFQKRENNGEIFNHRFQAGARPYVGHTGSGIDWTAKTLKAGDHGVPGGENMIAFHDGTHRYFTIREAARIQTFPDTWHFKGAWSEAMRQLGNAVPVDLAKVVAKSVAATLSSSTR